MSLVLVIWDDASVDAKDDTPENIQHGTCINFTCGWLLRKTKKDIVLVWDATPADNTVRWVYTIPRKLVLHIVDTEIHPILPPKEAKSATNLPTNP